MSHVAKMPLSLQEISSNDGHEPIPISIDVEMNTTFMMRRMALEELLGRGQFVDL